MFFNPEPQPDARATAPAGMLRARAGSGFAIIQALMAMAVVVVAGMASVQALILTNRKAAAMRTVNNARAIVQQKIDTALGVPFSSPDTIPTILTITATAGDGGVPIAVVVARNGTDQVVPGTLTRIVAAETNSVGADIRRVTFRIDYTYRSRPQTFSMSTLRASD